MEELSEEELEAFHRQFVELAEVERHRRERRARSADPQTSESAR